jgi:hypothetical protein
MQRDSFDRAQKAPPLSTNDLNAGRLMLLLAAPGADEIALRVLRLAADAAVTRCMWHLILSIKYSSFFKQR